MSRLTTSEARIDLSVADDTSTAPLLALRRLTAAVGLAMCADPEPAVVMDLSCRRGEMLEQVRLMSPGSRLIGIDPWQDSVLAARRRLGGAAEVCQMNGEAVRSERLPSLRHGIDLAISTLAISSAPRSLNTLASVLGKLKIGGQLYLTDIVPPREVRERSLLLSLASGEESREQLSSMASAAIGPPELFGLLSDAATASGRTTAIRISTGGLGGFASGTPQAQQLARDPRVRAALEAMGAHREIVDQVVLHAHLVREA